METIVIDHQFQEVLSFSDAGFPIQYYVDNLNQWAEYQVPLHWHCGYEIFTALHQDIEVQAGQEHLILQKGESIFIRGGQLHSYRMTEPGRICLCPNIVFTEEVLAPAAGTVFKKYFSPVLNNPALPYIILRGNKLWQTTLTEHLFKIYALLAANVPENHSDCGAIKPLQSDCRKLKCIRIWFPYLRSCTVISRSFPIHSPAVRISIPRYGCRKCSGIFRRIFRKRSHWTDWPLPRESAEAKQAGALKSITPAHQ